MGKEYITEEQNIVKKYIKRIRYKCDACGEIIGEVEAKNDYAIQINDDNIKYKLLIFEEKDSTFWTCDKKLYECICHDNFDCLCKAIKKVYDNTEQYKNNYEVFNKYSLRIINMSSPKEIAKREIRKDEIEEENNNGC